VGVLANSAWHEEMSLACRQMSCCMDRWRDGGLERRESVEERKDIRRRQWWVDCCRRRL